MTSSRGRPLRLPVSNMSLWPGLLAPRLALVRGLHLPHFVTLSSMVSNILMLPSPSRLGLLPLLDARISEREIYPMFAGGRNRDVGPHTVCCAHVEPRAIVHDNLKYIFLTMIELNCRLLTERRPRRYVRLEIPMHICSFIETRYAQVSTPTALVVSASNATGSGARKSQRLVRLGLCLDVFNSYSLHSPSHLPGLVVTTLDAIL
jgi:hypothetical protein